MEKSRQELVDNYKAEQRAIKVRKVLRKTKEWGENIAALILIALVVLAVIMFCVAFWELGLGFLVLLAGVILTAVVVWNLVDNWSYNELEKARYRRSKTREED